MSNLAFDTHKFVKDLTRNGMPDKQAEVLADHYASLLNDRLATKDGLASLRTELKGDIKSLRTELKGDIEGLRKDMMIAILSAQLVGIVTISAVMGLMLTL